MGLCVKKRKKERERIRRNNIEWCRGQDMVGDYSEGKEKGNIERERGVKERESAKRVKSR